MPRPRTADTNAAREPLSPAHAALAIQCPTTNAFAGTDWTPITTTKVTGKKKAAARRKPTVVNRSAKVKSNAKTKVMSRSNQAKVVAKKRSTGGRARRKTQSDPHLRFLQNLPLDQEVIEAKLNEKAEKHNRWAKTKRKIAARQRQGQVDGSSNTKTKTKSKSKRIIVPPAPEPRKMFLPSKKPGAYKENDDVLWRCRLGGNGGTDRKCILALSR